MAEQHFMSPLDAVFWDWNEQRSGEDLSAAVATAVKLNGGKATQVVFETVFTDHVHPFDHIHPTGVEWYDRRAVGGAEFLRVRDDDGQWALAAFPTRYAGVFHLVSGLPATNNRWDKAERWLVRARGVSRCYLNHDDFASIGDRLSEFGDVEVVRATARKVKDGSSFQRSFKSRAGSLRPSHREQIAEVEAFGATVRTITLHVASGDNVHEMDVHLRRVAGATFYAGNFDVFAGQVLTRLEDATAARRALLTGRQRVSAGGRVRPVTVTLPAALLRTADDTGDLLDLVRGMTDMSLAVFHRNPYLHFTVTDEFDGSNFDLMVTRADAIDIYPGYRASVTALARVAQRLGERFGALAITDQPRTEQVSLADLVTD